ncbi:MAG: hypothetical protein AUJ07_02750 [Crenarchaeota archaeon 13_1_40CM_3_53_5]|nr:MAG: hypothetical protein AUJ07_02750 [Crenarchaeota archaeon 13_1_40CM_3_53_5]
MRLLMPMAICLVCDLPYMTRREIEETVRSGMPVEEVESWVGLRFRLKITSTVLREHHDRCQQGLAWMRKLLEGGSPEPSVLVYFNPQQKPSANETQDPG